MAQEKNNLPSSGLTEPIALVSNNRRPILEKKILRPSAKVNLKTLVSLLGLALFSISLLGAISLTRKRQEIRSAAIEPPTPTPTLTPTPTPTLTPTPTGEPTPTPTLTPTLTIPPTASCQWLKTYDENWETIADYSTLSAGDAVYFGALPSFTGGNVDSARFRVNGGDWQVTTDQNTISSETFYYLSYLIPENTYHFVVEAEIHHVSLGWL